MSGSQRYEPEIEGDAAGGGGGASGTVGPSNVLYVDATGDDATGARGNAARPFLTIQAAIDAAQAGDVVSLAPQAYAITAPITIPASVLRLSIVGTPVVGVTYGYTAPRLIGALDVDVFDLGANLGLVGLSLNNLYVECAGTGIGIKAHGDLYGQDEFLNEGLILTDTLVFSYNPSGSYALSLRYVSTFLMQDGYTYGNNNVVSCGSTWFVNAEMSASSLRLEYLDSDPLVSLYGPDFEMFGGFVSNITLVGQPYFYTDLACSIVGTLTGDGLAAGASNRPYIRCEGTISNIDFQSTAAKMLPSTASAMTLDFTGARIEGFGGGNVKFAVTAPSLAQTVRMDGVTGNAITFTAGAGINLSAKVNSARTPTYITSGTGTIDLGQTDLLWEWNGTSVAQFGAPVGYARFGGGGPSNASLSISAVAAPAGVAGTTNVLRMLATGLTGGYFWPIASLSLPSSYVIEIEYCNAPTYTTGNPFVALFAANTGGAGGVDAAVLDGSAGSNAQYLGCIYNSEYFTFPTLCSGPTYDQAVMARGIRLIAQVSRQTGTATSTWRVAASSAGGGGPTTSNPGCRASSQDSAAADNGNWNGLDMGLCGPGIYVGGGAPASITIDIRYIKIWARKSLTG